MFLSDLEGDIFSVLPGNTYNLAKNNSLQWEDLQKIEVSLLSQQVNGSM